MISKKPFDSLNWQFILAALATLGFPSQFVSSIEKCITKPRFSISVNGGLIGKIRGARGVGQGDPLSPYLFVIAMHVLSKLLDVAAFSGLFSYHSKCHKLRSTHLSFPDDLLIFSKGNLETVVGIQCVLQQFYFFSGLQLNPAKSEIFFLQESQKRIFNISAVLLGLKEDCFQ